MSRLHDSHGRDARATTLVNTVINGPRRHYIVVALTHHPKGDDYLVGLAKSVDDLLAVLTRNSNLRDPTAR